MKTFLQIWWSSASIQQVKNAQDFKAILNTLPEGTIEEPKLPYLRDIDEDRFMYELSIMESWAKDNGQGFVTVYWLIYQVLRRKHFDFHTSKKIMQKLKDEGKIELYHVDGNANLCIKTK